MLVFLQPDAGMQRHMAPSTLAMLLRLINCRFIIIYYSFIAYKEQSSGKTDIITIMIFILQVVECNYITNAIHYAL